MKLVYFLSILTSLCSSRLYGRTELTSQTINRLSATVCSEDTKLKNSSLQLCRTISAEQAVSSKIPTLLILKNLELTTFNFEKNHNESDPAKNINSKNKQLPFNKDYERARSKLLKKNQSKTAYWDLRANQIVFSEQNRDYIFSLNTGDLLEFEVSL